MSKNLSGFPTKPYIGAPYYVPINLALSQATPEGARTVPLTFDWASYGASTASPNIGVSVDLANNGVSPPISVIRSVYIDNTFSDVAIYVQFLDTKFTITVPPRAVVMSPAETNGLKFIVYGEGFFSGRIPQTTVYVSNVEKAGYVIETDFSNGIDATLVFNSQSTAIALSYAFNNVVIGAAKADRILVLAVTGTNGTAGFTVGVTVNGVAANKIIEVNQALRNSAGADVPTDVALFYLAVPTGTTANIVVTFAGTANVGAMTLAVFTMTKQTANAPVSSASAFVGAVTTANVLNTAMAVIPGSVSIYLSAELVSNATIPTWFGASMVGFNFTVLQSLKSTYAQFDGVAGEYHNAGVLSQLLLGATWN